MVEKCGGSAKEYCIGGNLGAGGRAAYLGPSFDAILDHEPLGHRCRYVDHVIAVVFLAHAWLAVAADGKAEELVLCWTRGFRHFRIVKGCHRYTI